jgi:diguanylate cyclase (GGDEF)-like protein
MVDVKTDELRHQALHDALTQLPNRALIMDRTERLLARARRDGTTPAALFIDLDGFKAINDTLGHATGDYMLRAVSARLQGVMREGDTVGRLGGDEFIVLLDGPGAMVRPELVAQRILDVLREPFALPPSSGTFTVTASIGVAEGDRSTPDELLRDADIALYEAKDAGRDRYVVFEPQMHVAVHDRVELERELRAAVADQEMFLVYQPTVDLNGLAVTGLEALVRWNHPTRGVLLPAVFIPLAEETGLIVEMGRFVLDQACRQAALWHAQGFPVEMSVNVSARQLDSASLRDDVALALQASGLDAQYLILEITETTLMRDPKATAALLHEIKSLGVRIAIDDFGTGYSSLAYLQQFPVDALKIDRSFVSGVAHSTEADALINTLVQLGKSLGLNTLAEGIEDDDQLSHIQRSECESGQGYLFGRPMDSTAIQTFLETAYSTQTPAALPGVPRPRAAVDAPLAAAVESRVKRPRIPK